MRHRFHALCPYFAMFPESFAERWIRRLTKPGDCVLDPFSGRGTTALTALLLGRRAVACDVNDVAFCVTRAKTQAPLLSTMLRRVEQLQAAFDPDNWKAAARAYPAFFQVAYQPETLRQLLYLRQVLNWRRSRTDAMVASLVLGSLHGESKKSSSYLSNQMPRTISTKPAYSIRFWRTTGFVAPKRDVFSLIRDRAVYRYESPRPEERAHVIHGDMRGLPRLADQFPERVKCIITSPPYFDVTNFEEDQWLRLWFLGGPPQPNLRRLSRDDRYRFEDKYWRFIADMWRSFGQVVSKGAHIIVRLGSSRISSDDLRKKLKLTSAFAGCGVRLVSSRISTIRRPQTNYFRPGAHGCRVEVDCHFLITS